MKKQVKKGMSLFLMLAMVICLTACGGGSNKETDGNTKTDGSTAADSTSGGELADEQVLGIYRKTEPATLDPWVNNSGEAGTMVAAVHEPMLRKADNDKGYEPALMTDYTVSDDHTVHTLTLREGAKWSDGTDITADDIVYSIQRVLDQNLGSEIAYKYYVIKNAEAFYKGEAGAEELGVKASGNQIEITTSEPCDYFQDILTGSQFCPVQKKAAEEFGDAYGTDADKTVASGPFKLTEWVHENSMVLEKNENYWDAENVTLERINITITSDDNTVQGMYQNDELGILQVKEELLEQYSSENITDVSSLRVTFIEFNPNNNEFMSNKNIREALSIAFNRKLFAEQVMHNGELAAYGLVPRGVKGMDGGDFREQAGDIVTDASDQSEIDRANELLDTGLKEIGKTKEEMEKGFSIQCLESGKNQAQAIQNMWKTNLGIEMPVSVLEINVLLPMLTGGTFDCVIGGGQDSEYRDPQGFMQFIYDEGKWDNDEFRALVEKAHSQTGDERIQTWMDIEKMVLDNFIYIPQIYAENHWAVKPYIQGLKIFDYGYEFDFKHVSVTK